MNARSNEQLKTAVSKLEYDFYGRTCRIHVPAGCCTDMEGATQMAESIDPGCHLVHVLAEGNLDIAYSRHNFKLDGSAFGSWTAKSFRQVSETG